MTYTTRKLAAPALMLALGCTGITARPNATDTSVTRGQSADTARATPATTKAKPPAPQPVAAEAVHSVLPVSLDAVLQLAEGQNPQLAIARERVRQAYAERDLADLAWLPEIRIGAGYYRHEGGIQDQDGTFLRSSTGAVIAGLDLTARLDLRAASFAKLDAARKELQQKGELRRLTTEVALDAANTYIDLLAAYNGLAIAHGLETDLRALRDRAQRLANLEKGARIQVMTIDAEMTGQGQIVHRLEAQAKAAAAKLAYLLGLDSCTELVPVDDQLVALALADADAPVCDLVNRALACGPGVRELEGILALIQDGMSQASGPQRFVPVVTAQALEGGFGAGPNSDLTFANRFDLGVQARWNISELLTADANKRIACSGLAQVQLTYADVRGKLTLGVREAREAILSGREQLRLAAEQIQLAKDVLDLAELRLRENITTSYTEVLQAQRATALARANYLTVLREFDKAQLRLMVLTGCHCLSAGQQP